MNKKTFEYPSNTKYKEEKAAEEWASKNLDHLVWEEPETPLDFILPGKKERSKLLKIKIKKIFNIILKYIGLSCILFVLIAGSIRHKPHEYDKAYDIKSELEKHLDNLQSIKEKLNDIKIQMR